MKLLYLLTITMIGLSFSGNAQNRVDSIINNPSFFHPLYIVDGVIMRDTISPFKTIANLNIKRISVMKDIDAVKKYGSTAEDGVILITTGNWKKHSQIDCPPNP